MKHFYRMARMLLLIVCSMTVGLPQAKAQSSVINGIEYYDDVFTYDVIYSASDLGNYIEKKYVGTDYYLHTREYIKITGLKERWLTQHPEGAEAIEIPRTLRGSVYMGDHYYDYDLPVLDISSNAFKDNKYIKHVLVNDNLVRFQGFSGCTNLEDVTFVGFPKLIAFGDEALYGCEKLLSIEIPSSVDCIGQDAFRGCKSLMFVDFENGYTYDYIRDNAFRDCPKLARVSFQQPTRVFSWGRNVFTGTALTGTIANLALSPHMYEGCENLMYVVGSENWAEIPHDCFTDCPNIVQIDLTQTYIKDLNLSALPTENVAFFELNDDLETIWGKWRGDKLTQFELSPSVREIGKDAFPNKELVFKGKCNLTHSLSHSFPNLETVYVFDDIKSNFARDCANLKTVIIRGQCKNIGDYAFMNCPNLEYASFGLADAPNVGDFAFADCPKLRQRGEIRLGNVGASAFRGCQFDATKFVGAHFKENSLGDKYTATIEMSDCTADARAFNGANFSDLVIPGTGIDRFGRNAFEGAHGKLTFEGTDKDSWYHNSSFSGALFTIVTTQDDALPEHIFYDMPALGRVVAPNLTPRLGFLATFFTPKFQGYAEVNNNNLKSVAQQNVYQTYYMTYSADMKTLYHVGDACGGIAKVAPECRTINSSIGQWPGNLATLMVLDLRDVTGNVTLTGSIDFKVPYGLITPGTESQFADLAKAGMQFITEYKIGDSNHDGQVDVEDIVVTATELGK